MVGAPTRPSPWIAALHQADHQIGLLHHCFTDQIHKAHCSASNHKGLPCELCNLSGILECCFATSLVTLRHVFKILSVILASYLSSKVLSFILASYLSSDQLCDRLVRLRHTSMYAALSCNADP